uniref:Negative regulator of ubiquitin like proteins 1 n=1 Tax=Scleropages formosus TaxID=113540 RepID=A0A8C9RHQ7_SCLFO
MTEENLQSKLKNALRNDKIQLWTPPYTTENNEAGQKSLQELATRYTALLGFPADRVLDALEVLRVHALRRGRGNDVFRESGVAALELILPSDPRKVNKTYFNTKLDVTAQDAMKMICEKFGLQHIKLILSGKILNPEKRLDEQGVKHNSRVMVLKKSEPETQQRMLEEEQKKKSQDESVRRTQKGFQILSERDGSQDPETTPFLEIADQKGNPLEIPPAEKKALIVAMGFHEKGRALMKRKDYESALCHLLEADDSFSKCDSTLLDVVDNYGVLQLDIVWCYRKLVSLTSLNDARHRLKKAEDYFLKSYGEENKRLLQIKGNTGREEVLFLRLYLLQSLQAYLEGHDIYAAQQLQKVESLYQQLNLDPDKMMELMSLGYTEQEARLGLRACKGDTNAAALHISQRREEKEKMKQTEREKRMRRVEAITVLQQIGYSRKDAAVALHKAKGDLDRANMLSDSCVRGLFLLLFYRFSLQLVSLGFSREAVENALRRTRGDVQRASELLLDSGSSLSPEELSPSPPSSLSEEPSTSSESAGEFGSFLGDDAMDNDLVNEVLDDIPSHEEDYLDLTLEEECEFIVQMRSYLEKRNALQS